MPEMCGMCKAEKTFESLTQRAEQARQNDDRRGLRQIAQELEMVFFTIETEERESDDFAETEPLMRDRFDKIRRVIVYGENPDEVFGDSPNVKVFASDSPADLLAQIQAALGGKKEEEPSLEDWLMSAQVDVEKSLLRAEPIIRFVSELRKKFEAAGFSETVAEQMAAQVFIGTMGGSR